MLGWYAYAFAAEPFVVSAVATYVPLLLEGLARDNAVLALDHRTPCRVPSDVPGLLPTPIAPAKCVVKLGWMWIDTSSLPLYTFAFSVAVQTVIVVSISGVADRSYRSRKSLLVGFAIVGSLSTIAIAQLKGMHYYLAAAMAVIGNACFGAVTVCGNAYIPALVGVYQKRTAPNPVALPQSDYGTFSHPEAPPVEDAKTISSRISGRGAAIGYMSALVVQVITMAILVLPSKAENSSSTKLRSAILFIGWWWLLGQIPVYLFLNIDEEKSGDTLIADEAFVNQDLSPGVITGRADRMIAERTDFLSDVASGWIGLISTVKKAQRLKDISLFLVGWFLLSDAVTTINSTAVLFARTNLGMATPALALIGLITVVFAISGSLLCSRRASTSMVSIALVGCTIPLYGILGFFQPWIGLNHSWELYALASWYGFMLGALNAVTRSMYSLLIPKGHEVMFFALYAVTDKGSSILGPTVTGMITDTTHNIRYTFYFLLGMMLLAASVFSRVDYERGVRDAAALEHEEDVNAGQ